jgi:hypothetical protein
VNSPRSRGSSAWQPCGNWSGSSPVDVRAKVGNLAHREGANRGPAARAKQVSSESLRTRSRHGRG